MKNMLYRLIPALIFLVVAALALFRNSDYVEAGIWSCFAIMVLLGVGKGINIQEPKSTRVIAYIFGAIGIVLLILRLLGFLPVPIKPLP